MVQLFESGAYLIDGKELIADNADAAVQVAAKTGRTISKEEAAKQTMAYKILQAHNTSGDDEHLKVKFDRLTSHDITFVGIIQTARASGLEKFPSTRMIICLVFPVHKNTAVSMYLRI